MSLINDYLKKTEQNKKGSTAQAGDLPPVLKSIGRSSGKNLYLRIISLLLLILIVGAGLYLYLLPGKIKKDYGLKKRTAVTITADRLQESNPVKKIKPETDSDIKPDGDESELKTEDKLVSLPIAEIINEKADSKIKTIATLPDKKNEPDKSDILVTSIKKQQEVKPKSVNINSYYQAAFYAQRDGNCSEAERLYNEVLKQNPAHIDALTNLTVINIDSARYENAKKYIKQIRKYEPDNTKSYVNEGLINLKSGNTESAIKAFETALSINKNDEAALTNLAYIASIEKNTDLMKKCYENLSTPDNNIALTYASMLENEARYREAIDVYAGVIDNPENKKKYQLMNSIRDRVKLISAYQN